MNQFKFTPSFLALLKDLIEGSAQATVRDLCEAHVRRPDLVSGVRHSSLPPHPAEASVAPRPEMAVDREDAGCPGG